MAVLAVLQLPVCSNKRANTHKNLFMIPFKFNGILSYWQFSSWLWNKQKYALFRIRWKNFQYFSQFERNSIWNEPHSISIIQFNSIIQFERNHKYIFLNKFDFFCWSYSKIYFEIVTQATGSGTSIYLFKTLIK